MNNSNAFEYREKFKKVSIVIPVYNEVATLEKIVERVKAVQLPLEREIILVDDGSVDGTIDLIRQRFDDPQIVKVFHPVNQGKGAALRTGFAKTTGDIVLKIGRASCRERV